MNDAIKLTGFSAILILSAVLQNATAGFETSDTAPKKVLYQVCFKPTEKSKISCEPEKLVIEDALKRCAKLLEKFKFCEVRKV
jgi:hypothetical protein